MIPPSTSAWNSPVIIVRKKYVGARIVVDFHSLNVLQNYLVEIFPMLFIAELLSSLCGCSFFSSLELERAFWQIPLASEDSEKTVFTTTMGHYEFNAMAFGLRNSPANFCQNITLTIQPGSSYDLFTTPRTIALSPYEIHLQFHIVTLLFFRTSGFFRFYLLLLHSYNFTNTNVHQMCGHPSNSC